MSKMDAMRAMREARYEASRTAAPTRTSAPKPATAPTRVAAPSSTPTSTEGAPDALVESPGDELCGHRAISGRTCTREKGHSAKSHRYS